MSIEEKVIKIMTAGRHKATAEVFGYDQKMERMLVIVRWLEAKKLFNKVLNLERVEIKWVAMPGLGEVTL